MPQVTAQQLLRNFRDQEVKPKTTEERLMVVGTGGLNLWERLWSRYAANNNHIARAMRFAKDISLVPQAKTTMLSLYHYRLTPEGMEQRKQFPEVLQAEDPPNPLTPFVKKYPNDWDILLTAFETLCQDALDLGEHLIMLAFVDNNPVMLTQGQDIMDAAASKLESIDTHDTPTMFPEVAHTLQPWPGPQGNPVPTALRTRGYVELFNHTFLEKHDLLGLPAVAEYIAATLTARLTAQARKQTNAFLAAMPADNDRIPMAMRELSDQQLKPGLSGLTPRIEQHIATLSTASFETAFEELRDFQEALLAVAFTNRYNKDDSHHRSSMEELAELRHSPDPDSKTVTWLAKQRDSIPVPPQPRTGTDLLQEMIARKAQEHFDEAARRTPPMEGNQFHHHLHQAAALTRFLETTNVRACVSATRHHPEFLEFLELLNKEN